MTAKKCPKCHLIFGADVRFCRIDGTELIEAMSVCTSDTCKAEVWNDDKFCSTCGHNQHEG